MAHFYDIESGRKDLSARGLGRGHERFAIPVPRDGGIQDLLAEAARPDRRFNAVICESIDRIARRTYIGTQIENRLEQLGVLLLCADEPIILNGKRASQILTRRVKQGVAEWYVLELLEKSWGGFEAHTEQGYNVGKPCYGYAADKIPHPVPARRAEGRTKHRLVPDPVCGPVVTHIFALRVVERLAYREIAERLNRDLDRYPPPTPVDPDRALGRWTGSSIREVLINPKYTGYMVWNRRATKKGGSCNPPELWVWSSQPAHEPLVTRETFLAAQKVAAQKERSRSAAGVNSAHPQAVRSYPLRSYVFCAACRRRMFGKTRIPYSYYACVPAYGHRPEGHPPAIYVREDRLMDGVSDFFARRIFGSARWHYLDHALADGTNRAMDEYQAKADALRRAIADIDSRRARLVRTLETTDDPIGDLVQDIHARAARLAEERAAKHRELGDLQQVQPVRSVPELLDVIPVGTADLALLPEVVLRRLFDAFRLEIHFDKPTNTATCRVTITGDTLQAIRQVTATALQRVEEGAAEELPICAVPPARYGANLRRLYLRLLGIGWWSRAVSTWSRGARSDHLSPLRGRTLDPVDDNRFGAAAGRDRRRCFLPAHA
ncbi:recombinase family protein [Spongiactinospora gelatinilytica]|uniref:recombinase family protein n=1 Tax=Spongiactinospora gelatinilytica TaxID=2666298 RepID=UPI0018F3FE7A|nr:recombinase family protein [Spongiactinospora gelatinilytica]